MAVMTILLRLIFALFVLAVAGFPSPPPAAARPALWVARDADTTIWLFGTVHELKPNSGWFAGPVRDAFQASDTLVLELVAPPAAEVQAQIAATDLPADTPSLPDRLPPGYAARLRDALTTVGYPADAFDRRAPWVAATSLSILPLRQAGYARERGPEAVLTRAAGESAKPVEGLETQTAQLAMYDTLSMATQLAMLTRVLDGQAGAVPGMDRTVAAWEAGDIQTLGRIVGEDMAKAGADVQAALLARRHAAWAGRIADWMAVPGTRFVAVGTGHLVGTGTLQEALAARGVAVRRVR